MVGSGVHDRGDLLSGPLDSSLCPQPVLMGAGPGVAELDVQELQHEVADARIDRRRGVAVEVDGHRPGPPSESSQLTAWRAALYVIFLTYTTSLVTYRARRGEMPKAAAGTPEPAFEYVFPAIRGVQAGREYYVSMCPLRLVPKVFLFNEEELVPELRAQRILNRARLPEMTQYILANRDNYVFSALTASLDGDVKFEPLSDSGDARRIGRLRVPMESQFVINDGQHRRAAIENALREDPDLADESIAVVFFIDLGLERCQQMFADLNRYAVRPSKSLGVLYDHRDERAQLVRMVVQRCPVFRDVVEMERTTLAARSRKLFTLSAIYSATSALMMGRDDLSAEERAELAAGYWNEVAKQFPDWEKVRNRDLTAGEIRRDFIHSHGIVLQALGRAGNALLQKRSPSFARQLKKLRGIDWSRSNGKLWEGRALVAGRVSKAGNNVILTTNVVKRVLGLSLTPDEERVEAAFKRGDRGR